MTEMMADSDTSAEALAVQLDCLRRLTPQARFRKMCAWSKQIRQMAFSAIRRRFPGYSAFEVRLAFIELNWGRKLAEDVRTWHGRQEDVMEGDDLVQALSPVCAAFESLKIPHSVGERVASSFHGAIRSTMDVDVVAELVESQIPPFLSLVNHGYYVSEPAIRDAVRRRGCFNLIHLATSFKVDVFVSRERPFDRDAMRRATRERLGDPPLLEVPVGTPEDTIISKLEWYRKTNETSGRQWDDVKRLLLIRGESADIAYLTSAAESLQLTDLLQRLLGEH